MSARLAGRRVVVTGAAQGIGRGVALAAATEGAHVALLDRDPRVAETAEEVATRGSECMSLVCDVGDRASVRRAIEAVAARWAGIDVVVNNACAAVTDVALVDLTDDDMDLAWRSGVLGTLYVMQAAYPHLVGRHSSVVNFGSIAGPTGMAGCGAYGPAKEAIRSLTKVAAREWGSAGIRVNAVCPNAESPARQQWRESHPEVAATAEIENIPLGRVGDCELDVGTAVVFLASDDSRYVTGHTLMVDGGSCAW